MATFTEDIEAALQEIRVTYARDAVFVNGGDTITLENVVIGKRLFRFVDDNGFMIHTETRDFIVEVSQMGGVEPRIGNTIRETIQGYVHTFKVVSLNNEPCWYYSDDNENTMRIHTQFQSKEAV